MWLPCTLNMQHSVWESRLTCGSCAQLTCSILIYVHVFHLPHSFQDEVARTQERHKFKQQVLDQRNYATCSTVHVFTGSTVHVLHVVPYTFSEIADRNWNYIPSGCVVPGSRFFHTFGCCFVNCRGVLMRCTISGFLVLLGWAPCQVGTRFVELASLSSKSTCNLCVAFGVQGAVLASAFLCPVCSISWLGSSREEGPIPIGELEKIDLMFVCKVGDICWLKLK